MPGLLRRNPLHGAWDTVVRAVAHRLCARSRVPGMSGCSCPIPGYPVMPGLLGSKSDPGLCRAPLGASETAHEQFQRGKLVEEADRTPGEGRGKGAFHEAAHVLVAESFRCRAVAIEQAG